MTEGVSREDVWKRLKGIMHPEIDSNLVDLGMIKDVDIVGKRVTVILALPFLWVPLRDKLIHLVEENLTEMGKDVEVDVKLVEMSQKERSKFFTMARKLWKL